MSGVNTGADYSTRVGIFGRFGVNDSYPSNEAKVCNDPDGVYDTVAGNMDCGSASGEKEITR